MSVANILYFLLSLSGKMIEVFWQCRTFLILARNKGIVCGKACVQYEIVSWQLIKCTYMTCRDLQMLHVLNFRMFFICKIVKLVLLPKFSFEIFFK